jgi:hypothetical protein
VCAVVQFAWSETMPNKKLFAAVAIGVTTTISGFLIGQQLGSAVPTPEPRSTPNALCFKDTAPDQFSPKHVETKLIACQTVGMTKPEAIAFIEGAGLVYRIAYEDGDGFALTEDYTDSRINLEIVTGLVVGASAW